VEDGTVFLNRKCNSMKISQKRSDELYKAIHDSIVDVRISLKLPAKDDVTLAQVEHEIWRKQKQVLGL
jgi:hypothetical protein